MKKPLLTFVFTVLNLLNCIFFFTLPLFGQTFESVDTAWVRRYNGTGNNYDEAYAMKVDGSGNIYVTGRSRGSGTMYDYVTIKYYPNGDTAWLRRYNGPGNVDDEASAIAIGITGNVYITGYSIGSGTSKDYVTIKYDQSGNELWVRRYNGPGNSDDYASAIFVDGAENVYVTGTSTGSGTFEDYATIKYYSNGDTAWVRRYDGSAGGYDGAKAITVDGSGNVYVTGGSLGSGTNYDCTTIKYSPTGSELWIQRYNGPANSSDDGLSIAIDNFDTIYVTGRSTGIGTNLDYVTIKYSPAGNELWVRRYDGPANYTDQGRAIVIDYSNNIYVTGYSVRTGTYNYDYTTIKYYPNGDTAWVRRYDGPGNNWSDYAVALALDNEGNVYVTGYSDGSGTVYDYATIKYAPTGESLWTARYNGPGNDDDNPYAVAVDDSGYVYVTGYSYDAGTFYDYTTIKYMQFQVRHDTLRYFAYSPVDLIVTDPIGHWINKDSSLIPDATYDTTTDKNGDGDLDDIVTIPNPIIGEYIVEVKREPDADTGHYSLRVKLDGNEDKPLAQNFPIPPPDQVDSYTYPVIEYLRGDANTDKKTTVSDVIFLINYLFKGGPAPNPVYLGDVNCDGKTTVSDVVYLINYLFKNGLAPCS